VALELWPVRPLGSRFTTVTTWRNDKKHRVWRGEKYYWTKDREFLAIADLPRHTRATLELAIDNRPSEASVLEERGWRLVDGVGLGPELDPYRDYIIGSRGEFTVARDQVVRPRTGWFSDRSACYLAAGRPVVTQDTGFGKVLPTGEGLFAFRGLDDAAAALDEIEADPERHSAAAREIAEEYFAAEKVLSRLIADVFSARAPDSGPVPVEASTSLQRC
jgi:glycosyltransferase involved in cell wall biosynthesis